MSNIIYEAAVYSRNLSYKNYNQEERNVTLHFALDPLSLMQLIAGFALGTSKSGNPALRGKPEEVSGEQQLKFMRKLAVTAAGTPTEDGESWIPFEKFEESLAGKAFLTKLTSSDGDRREFAEKVILDPFRAFVQFAEADDSNTPAEVQEFKLMLDKMERIFTMPEAREETVEEKRDRLRREMAMLDESRGVGAQMPTE